MCNAFGTIFEIRQFLTIQAGHLDVEDRLQGRERRTFLKNEQTAGHA